MSARVTGSNLVACAVTHLGAHFVVVLIVVLLIVDVISEVCILANRIMAVQVLLRR